MKREKILNILGIVVLVVVVSLIMGSSSEKIGLEKTLQDKVLDKGTIRAGYVVYPPGSIKDPNTGELSGIFIEAVEEAGANLGLEIDWTEEVGWGTMIEGLATNRYDIIGSPVWPTAGRARETDFSVPLMYSAVGVYTRADDYRFVNSLNGIDSPNVRISTIDGEMSSIIADSRFPNAETVSLPQLASVSDMLLNVSQGKADVTFVDIYIGEQFLVNNPGTIKNIAGNNPIRVFGNSIVVKKGEPGMVSMLNTALNELINNGRIDELLEKYEVEGSFYPTANSFGSLQLIQ